MYWRLLTSNPTAARDIVLSEKPVISTETDRMDKGMLDQVSLSNLDLMTVELMSSSFSSPVLSVVYTTRIQTYVYISAQSVRTA